MLGLPNWWNAYQLLPPSASEITKLPLPLPFDSVYSTTPPPNSKITQHNVNLRRYLSSPSLPPSQPQKLTNKKTVEHNTTDPSLQTAPRRRRPDLSTFFATLSEISPDESRTRPHAVPVPRDVSAAFFSLAEAYEVVRRESGTAGAGAGTGAGEEGADVLTQMIQALLHEADMPPREVEGVKEEFCDG